MNPAGAKMRTNLTSARQAALADDNMRGAALIGGVQEDLMLARLNAVRFVGSPDAKLVETASEQLARLPSALTELEAQLTNPARKQLVRDTLALAPKYTEAFKNMAAATLEMYGLINGPMRIAADEFAKRAAQVKDSQVQMMTTIENETSSSVRASITLTFGIVAAAFALGLAVAFFIGRGIAKPVQGMTAAMGRLAGGDKTVAVPGVGYGDEKIGRAHV